MSLAPSDQPTGTGFDSDQLARFARDGYVIVPGLATRAMCGRMLAVAQAELAQAHNPLELEADLHYPGAPADRGATGGATVRRLLNAYTRDPVFRDWVHHPALTQRLFQLLGPDVRMPLAHHNCIMTKQPRFSSDTGWHQDIRYWSFTRPELVSVWLALGHECANNGGLRVIPGSHTWDLADDRFDAARFLREDLPENRDLLAQAVELEMNEGDVLFFHCRTLHAASRNHTDATKFSAVFTFRPADVEPLPESRSSAMQEIRLGNS